MDIKLSPEQIAELEADVVRLCQELIRIPSVNFGDGKGDEKAIAEFVVKELSEVGIASEIIETAPNRMNVVAKLIGTDSSRPGLVLHGHLDVVPANAADWEVDPFSGLIKDGCIWGRGAIDMKDMDAMILAIVRLWARIRYKPPRDIVLAFFADEEAGSIYGSRWIAKNRPELFAGCTEAISEVGGFSYTLDTGKRIYPVQSAEKGINWMKLTATGNAGHGSMINEKNAVTALTEAVAKIGRHKWPIRPTKTVKILFKKVAELTNVEYDENNLGKLLPKFGSMGSMIGATLQNIANPTMLEAGYKANVIPQSASAIIDGRFLPGYEAELAETIKELVGPEIKVEVLTRDIALEVDFSGPLVDAMCAALKSEDPEGIPVPYLMSGGTDNKALSDLGIAGFGFSPIIFPADLEFMPLFHGINERVPVDGIKFGVRTLHHFLVNC
ncbi:unannotated protein [freshwater metagenome]|uniref:Unannotated protein n=1 Tax=freshwater metagenome TaxID=449393 RepID=A0A6J7MTI2_9ZZZZ